MKKRRMSAFSCVKFLQSHPPIKYFFAFSKEQNWKGKMNFERALIDQTTYPDLIDQSFSKQHNILIF
jgi:hypothetical protein